MNQLNMFLFTALTHWKCTQCSFPANVAVSSGKLCLLSSRIHFHWNPDLESLFLNFLLGLECCNWLWLLLSLVFNNQSEELLPSLLRCWRKATFPHGMSSVKEPQWTLAGLPQGTDVSGWKWKGDRNSPLLELAPATFGKWEYSTALMQFYSPQWRIKDICWCSKLPEGIVPHIM